MHFCIKFCYFKCVLLFLFISLLIIQSDTVKRRQKRHLIYPKGGTFKIVVGVAIPIKLGQKQSMACGWNLQFQYGTPTNITQLRIYPPIVRNARKRREFTLNSDRALAYQGIEAILDRNGINGRACLLRSICDNAVESVHHEANGLYGHLLHIALTPNIEDGITEPDDINAVYYDAKKAGEYGVDCMTLYPECPYGNGLLDMISLLDD